MSIMHLTEIDSGASSSSLINPRNLFVGSNFTLVNTGILDPYRTHYRVRRSMVGGVLPPVTTVIG